MSLWSRQSKSNSKALDSFESQIRAECARFDRKQAVFFAWLCGQRALPFLAAAGNFNYWQPNERTRHLYSILFVLDVTGFSCVALAFGAADARRGAGIAAGRAVAAAVDVAAVDAAVAAAKAFDAALAAARAFAVADVAFDAALATARAFAVTDAAFARTGMGLNNAKFRDIILSDLKLIKKGNYNSFHHDTSVYGPVWNNFQKALRDIGCDYWGDLYTDIFNSGFVPNRKSLERRMNVPAEIWEQGAEVVADYLIQLEKQGGERLNEARVIILGDKGAGKTSLARRLIKPDAPMPEANESTEGVDTTLWQLPSSDRNETVNVHIWDFAGQVVTHAVHRCFLSERCLYVIVYDGRSSDRNSRDCLTYWLDHVKTYGGDSPVRILINLRDGHRPDIPENTLKDTYPNIIDFDYFNLGSNRKRLENFKNETEKSIRNHPSWEKSEIPANDFRVKAAVESLFNKKDGTGYELIEWEKFYKIAQENGIEDDRMKDLLKRLHYLGICLWYPELEKFNSVVINPDWISHGVYRLINWAQNEKRHTIFRSDAKKALTEEKNRYPEDKLGYLFQLMCCYELAYSTGGNSGVTVPFLLKEDQPKNLKERLPFPISESLLLEYKAEQPLPPNTVCRLIVRHHEEIRHENEVWRYGVVLTDGNGTLALVQEKDRMVSIHVKGPGKTAYIAKLRDSMNDIFKSYKTKTPELQYRMIPYGPSEFIDSIMLSEQIIRTYGDKNREYLEPVSGLEIPAAAIKNMAETYVIHLMEDLKPLLEELLKELRSAKAKLPLSDTTRQEYEEKITTLTKQISSSNPKNRIVEESLKSLRNILEGTAGSLIATKLLEKLTQFF